MLGRELIVNVDRISSKEYFKEQKVEELIVNHMTPYQKSGTILLENLERDLQSGKITKAKYDSMKNFIETTFSITYANQNLSMEINTFSEETSELIIEQDSADDDYASSQEGLVDGYMIDFNDNEEEEEEEEDIFTAEYMEINSTLVTVLEGLEKMQLNDMEDSDFYVKAANQCYRKAIESHNIPVDLYAEAVVFSIFYIYMYIIDQKGPKACLSNSYYPYLVEAYELAKNSIDKDFDSFKMLETMFYDIIKRCWNNDVEALHDIEMSVRMNGGSREDYAYTRMFMESFPYLMGYITKPSYTRRVIKSLRFLSLQLGII